MNYTPVLCKYRQIEPHFCFLCYGHQPVRIHWLMSFFTEAINVVSACFGSPSAELCLGFTAETCSCHNCSDEPQKQALLIRLDDWRKGNSHVLVLFFQAQREAAACSHCKLYLYFINFRSLFCTKEM